MTAILDNKKGLINKEEVTSDTLILRDTNTIEIKYAFDKDELLMLNIEDIETTRIIYERPEFSHFFWLIISVLAGFVTWTIIDNKVWAGICMALIWLLGLYLVIDKILINRTAIVIFELKSNRSIGFKLIGKKARDDIYSFIEKMNHKKNELRRSKGKIDKSKNLRMHKSRYSNKVYSV